MRTSLCLGALVLALSGCDSDALRVSLVPKRQATPATNPGAPPGHAGHGGAATPSLHWTLPEGWSQSPPEAGSMRYATLHAPAPQGQLDVGVFRFGGEAGGILANVNRWRAELSLAEVGEGELGAVLTPLEGKPGVYAIDWTGADGERGLLAAIVSLPQETWFFKAPGAAPQLQACRDEFLLLLGSLHLASGDHDHGETPTAPTPAPGAPAATSLPSWTVPARWTVEPAQAPRLASFKAGAEATLAVTRFPGEVGGALANLNRWRQQVGLPPLDAAPDPEPRVVDGVEGRWLDLRGERERMVICAVPHGGYTWFFKLRGPVAEVDDADPELAEFLDSVRWPAAAPQQPAPMQPTPVQPTPVQPTPVQPTPAQPPAAELAWDVPDGWTQAAEAGRMRIATIRAGAAELAITRFPGDVGGLLQNVNRWRRQIGLEPVLRVEDQPSNTLEVDGLTATRVDLAGPERALSVVLIPREGQTWFVKLAGEPAAVAAEEARFGAFVGSLRFGGEGQ